MLYDLRHDADRDAFKKQANFLYLKGAKVELTEKRGQRTLPQNRYLHLILSYFALQYGEQMEYIKQEFFKRRVNASTFVIVKTDKIFGEVSTLRSSAELSTKEMTDCIERFRDWSAKEADIYLPAPNEVDALRAISREVEEQRRYIE
ncbi:MAG: hypothetical protein Q4A64_07085 [Porphyromonadaceae bacterium]|nr:hypothetical protein [Porphyromonadaceae bacterium]